MFKRSTDKQDFIVLVGLVVGVVVILAILAGVVALADAWGIIY